MDASSTADLPSQTLEMPPWKSIANHIAALIVAILFIAAGVWKITNPFAVSRMLEQLLVPYSLSIPFTLTLAVLGNIRGRPGHRSPIPPMGSLDRSGAAASVHDLRRLQLQPFDRPRLQLLSVGEARDWSCVFPGGRCDAAGGSDRRNVGDATAGRIP